ncbi:metallophosphoesterase family protein [Sulfuriferula nivalis]|uniref:Phosphoesterase n=1 Tax=Sulfuriferula nivalis TaxID=2675298 RepID=A0A809RCW9_9PROT|nr:metallophosphoesterase family protein [Sulfuriferula nivalis]BBO99495.1 phosphoesterase [Sulfuriferula nivalis]
MKFFTSDQHFGHANILKYEDRRDESGNKFASIEAMDAHLVDRWNATVSADDAVYCIGDFAFKSQILRDILPFLNGTKILVTGNHDPFFKRVVNGQMAEAKVLALELGFSELHFQHEIEIEGIGLVQLSHFPYLPPSLEGLQDYELRYMNIRPKIGKESLLLHGHVHSDWKIRQDSGQPRMLNVGVDVWDMKPISEAEIVEFVMVNT